MTSSPKRAALRETIAWLLFCKGSVIRRQFLRFAGRSIAALVGRPESSRAPVPEFTLRLAVAGHVDLPERAAVTQMVHGILSALQHALDDANGEYTGAFRQTSEASRAECRLISQLAAGADQLVADQASGSVTGCNASFRSTGKSMRRTSGDTRASISTRLER